MFSHISGMPILPFFNQLTGTQFILVLAGALLLYYIVVIACFNQKLLSRMLPDKSHPLSVSVVQSSGFPHDLIARPVEMDNEPVEILLERAEPDEETLEILDDDDLLLVKEAEKVVEKIQVEIQHIASRPPDPLEVSSKIRAVVRQYQIFFNTEYFEPINRFIALTVKKDCDIDWTEQDILPLWN